MGLYPHPIKNPDYAHAPAYLSSKELNKYGTKTALYDNKGVRIVIKILKISIFVISPSVSKSGQLLTNSKLKSKSRLTQFSLKSDFLTSRPAKSC